MWATRYSRLVAFCERAEDLLQFKPKRCQCKIHSDIFFVPIVCYHNPLSSRSMLWNPFQYQVTATFLREEGEQAILEIHKGTHAGTILFPKSLLPHVLRPGETFVLKMEDSETARTLEIQTLRQLLNDLIQ